MEEYHSDDSLHEEIQEHHVDPVDLQADMEEQASFDQSSVSQKSQRRRGRPAI